MAPSIQEIETAVTQFTPAQFADFRAWFADYAAQVWDQQINADVAAGRLDALPMKPCATCAKAAPPPGEALSFATLLAGV